jgi:electron transport complex protein RnfD
MRFVLYALVPAAIVHVHFFGTGLLVNAAIATAAALASEALALRMRGVALAPFLTDGSAIVTAVLLAFALPPGAPWWLAASGAACAILIAKHLYGGLGFNLFNPAMVGYAVLLIASPTHMTAWPVGAARPDWDAMTMPTALDQVRTALREGATMHEIMTGPAFGTFGAYGYEWVSAAVLLGGLALLAKRVIRWHIPVAMLGTIAIFAMLLHGVDAGRYPGAGFELTSGATMLGAFFIATDPVSAATSPRGRLVYGAGIGALTYIIRTWGGYPDGVAFAVLTLNALVPLIDRCTVPRIYGHEH